MDIIKRVTFILVLLSSSFCTDRIGTESKTIQPDSSSQSSNLFGPIISYSQPENANKNIVDNKAQHMKHLQPAQGILQKHLFPILQEIEARSVHCNLIIDDPEALKDYQTIRALNDATKSDQFFDDEMRKSIERETFSADMEERLQLRAEGQITYAFPNASTVRALSQIHRKYPCAEASIIALLDISGIIWQPSHLYLGYQPLWSETEKSFLQYIISAYPNTWESKLVKYWTNSLIANSRIDKIEINRELIEYLENNDILNNKYFIIYSTRTDPRKNVAVDLYGYNIQTYFRIGIDAGYESIKDSGKLSHASIELCQKGFDLFDEAIKKYPTARDLRYSTKSFYLSPDHKLPDVLLAESCYNMIHRLGEFKDK